MRLYIITNAVLFSFLMTSEHIPQDMAARIMDRGFGMIGFLLMITYTSANIAMAAESGFQLNKPDWVKKLPHDFCAAVLTILQNLIWIKLEHFK